MKHPFTSGTGDHFNAAMVKEAGLQFAKLIAYERFNKKRVSELVANHTRYLFFLEVVVFSSFWFFFKTNIHLV